MDDISLEGLPFQSELPRPARTDALAEGGAGLPASTTLSDVSDSPPDTVWRTRFGETGVSTASAVSTGVASECPTPIPRCSTETVRQAAHASCRVRTLPVSVDFAGSVSFHSERRASRSQQIGTPMLISSSAFSGINGCVCPWVGNRPCNPADDGAVSPPRPTRSF